MELCSMCKRIKGIRLEQGRPYYYDLCDACKRKEIVHIFTGIRKKAGSRY